jgi:hypothetical protein
LCLRGSNNVGSIHLWIGRITYAWSTYIASWCNWYTFINFEWIFRTSFSWFKSRTSRNSFYILNGWRIGSFSARWYFSRRSYFILRIGFWWYLHKRRFSISGSNIHSGRWSWKCTWFIYCVVKEWWVYLIIAYKWVSVIICYTGSFDGIHIFNYWICIILLVS